METFTTLLTHVVENDFAFYFIFLHESCGSNGTGSSK